MALVEVKHAFVYVFLFVRAARFDTPSGRLAESI